jgi:hypothetical protein
MSFRDRHAPPKWARDRDRDVTTSWPAWWTRGGGGRPRVVRCVTSNPLAITQASVALCSTPCKVLRFAPTPRTAGPSDLDGVCAQLANLALT